MDNFVAEESDEECACCDYNDSGPARNIWVDGVNKLGADDDVDGRPSQAREAVEEGDWDMSELVGHRGVIY